MHSGKKLQAFLYSAAGLALLAAILVAANIMASGSGLRIDCSEERLNTLSQGTISILKGLKAPVTLRFYYTRDLAQMPVPLKNYASRVERMLKEYKRLGGDKLRLEILNPTPDSDAEDSANLNGVQGQSLPGGDMVYLGLAASCLDQSESIPFLSPEREDLLEYDLSSAISSVSRAGKPIVGLISPLPLAGRQMPPMMMGQQQGSLPQWMIYGELKKDYDIRDLGLDVESVPADVKLLLVVHPKNLPEKTLFAIDQYLLGGGRVAAFMDPFCAIDAKSSQQGMGMFSAPSASSTLGKLLDAWGVSFDTETVVADPSLSTTLRAPSGGTQRDPAWLSLTAADFDKADPSVAQLDSMLMVIAGAISGQGAEGLKKTILIKTSDDSGMVNKFVAQMGGESIMRDFKSDKQSKSLAVRLDGKFKTAFPDGAPSQDAAKPDSPEKKAESKPASLKESVKDGVAILVGDVDFLFDAFSVRTENVYGYKFSVPLNDNLSFVQNVAGLLSGDDALVGLRSRGVVRRPFTMVEKMQAAAEKQYRDQIMKLEQDLADAQRRIDELRRQKGDMSNQKFIMAPEVKETIAKFTQQEANTRKQLKELRKSLRKDIDTLELEVKWANMALMPALVAIVGVCVGLSRKWRSKKA